VVIFSLIPAFFRDSWIGLVPAASLPLKVAKPRVSACHTSRWTGSILQVVLVVLA
jgi:hypothetical protein